MPAQMQKESAQSNGPAGRKHPKHAQILGYFGVCPNQQNWTEFWTLSRAGDRIELIPFASIKASQGTSLENPQHIIPRTLKIQYF
jgi:hypothetical protein